jgi:hypothetical protein
MVYKIMLGTGMWRRMQRNEMTNGAKIIQLGKKGCGRNEGIGYRRCGV